MAFPLTITLAVIAAAAYYGALGPLFEFLWPAVAVGGLIGGVAALLPGIK